MTKQVLQFHITAINYKKALRWEGVFPSYDESDARLAELRKQGFSFQGRCGRMGVSPWGEWFSHYDHDAHLKAVGEWAGDYNFGGND